jgi:predicted lipoprotein with Yx(FWY)xxD motif
MFKFKNLLLVVLALLIAAPAAAPTQAAGELITLGDTKEFGKILVGKDGMTLYTYPPDPVNETVCYDQCAKAWPPLLVKSESELTKAEGIPGVLGTTKRKDDTLQVTYNGQPLYYWFKDTKAGDTTGHRVGRIWWVQKPSTVNAQWLPKVGLVLTGPEGKTLYMFTKDTAGESTCYDQCATNWPPLLVKSEADLVPGVNLPGKFSVTKRKDDTLQVTYNGMPLYYWKDDKAIGDATGEGVGKVWFTVIPETVSWAKAGEVGDVLTTFDGMTLYTFKNDTAGKSTCTGDCLKNWPAYTVGAEDRLMAGTDVKGKLDVITREDTKARQVTYDGMPLYLYAKDVKPGDATGNKAGDKWFVIQP